MQTRQQALISFGRVWEMEEPRAWSEKCLHSYSVPYSTLGPSNPSTFCIWAAIEETKGCWHASRRHTGNLARPISSRALVPSGMCFVPAGMLHCNPWRDQSKTKESVRLIDQLCHVDTHTGHLGLWLGGMEGKMWMGKRAMVVEKKEGWLW